MIELKCPFCQQELETGNYYVHCHNPNCNITVEMEGTEEMWLALIRTRKALEIAVDALKEYANEEHWDFEHFYSLYTYDKAKEALEQITALEQKDVK